MICILALIVFSILGIFSVKYRKLAIKAVDCVFRRVTLRPCQSGMDQKLRINLIGLISRKNIKFAKFTVKYFEIISWFFTILLIFSLIFSIRGIYFYVIYGNCNGENSDEFCVFDALNPKEELYTCEDPTSINSSSNSFLTQNINYSHSMGSDKATITIIEFGCYTCPYTKEAQDVVEKILDQYDGKIKFVFVNFPLPGHENSKLGALSSECAAEQDLFWQFHTSLMKSQNTNYDTILRIGEELNLNIEQFRECINTEKFSNNIQKEFEIGKSAGIYGTPTFFINDEVIIGPKPFRYFKNVIDKELTI